VASERRHATCDGSSVGRLRRRPEEGGRRKEETAAGRWLLVLVAGLTLDAATVTVFATINTVPDSAKGQVILAPCPTDNFPLDDPDIRKALKAQQDTSVAEGLERGGWIFYNTETGRYTPVTDLWRSRTDCEHNFSGPPLHLPPEWIPFGVWHTQQKPGRYPNVREKVWHDGGQRAEHGGPGISCLSWETDVRRRLQRSLAGLLPDENRDWPVDVPWPGCRVSVVIDSSTPVLRLLR
jgi:hypothetical protein